MGNHQGHHAGGVRSHHGKRGSHGEVEHSSDHSPNSSSPNSIAERTEELITRAFQDNRSDFHISESQKTQLRTSWLILQKNISSVGTVTFLKMFETHPETLKPFIPDVHSVKELELNEWYHENLRVHAIRVMAVIEKTMHRLNDEKRAAAILINYGRRHKGYGVKPHMLDLMVDSFLIAIIPSMEENWSNELEQSWKALFRFMVFFMKTGYDDADDSDEDESASSDKKSEGSNGSGCPVSGGSMKKILRRKLL